MTSGGRHGWRPPVLTWLRSKEAAPWLFLSPVILFALVFVVTITQNRLQKRLDRSDG